MSWLEKMGLVERSEAELFPVIEAEIPAEEASVDVEISSDENIVADIFSQNDLADKSDSIYTVQALIETLPPEMTTVKKQATVSGILAVSGKSVSSLLDDAQNRMNILQAAQEKIISTRSAEIENANADIESLKGAIEAATIKIKENEDMIAATKKAIEEEVAIITNLIEFCNGMEVNK